jgi:hypothetical protein
METKILKLMLKAMGIAFLVIVMSYYVLGGLLTAMFGYPSYEASFHLPTYALLVGLIFTVIFCTLLILDKLKNR